MGLRPQFPSQDLKGLWRSLCDASPQPSGYLSRGSEPRHTQFSHSSRCPAQCPLPASPFPQEDGLFLIHPANLSNPSPPMCFSVSQHGGQGPEHSQTQKGCGRNQNAFFTSAGTLSSSATSRTRLPPQLLTNSGLFPNLGPTSPFLASFLLCFLFRCPRCPGSLPCPALPCCPY
jgi:hypothetical protein